MKKGTLVTILILSILGITLSAELLFLHYQILTKGFGQKSFCTLNEWIDCDVVNGSSYAEIKGVPLAGLGLLYYLVVLGESLCFLVSKKIQTEGLVFLSHLTLGSFMITLFTAFVSLVKLQALCLLCGGLYLINILLLLLTFSNLRQTGQAFSSSRYWKHLLGGAAIFALGILLMLMIKHPQAQAHGTGDLSFLLKNYFNQQPVTLDPSGHPVWGNPSAKVKIIEFSDFECPFCRVAAQNFKSGIKEFKDRVSFYFINYPLDNSCNPYMQRPMHANACNAAKAAYCSTKEGLFWAYHDFLFENQKNLSSGELLSHAEKLGMNRDQMKECLFSEEALTAVRQDIEMGRNAAVSGTPTFFINGRRLAQWNNFNLVREIIKQELKQK